MNTPQPLVIVMTPVRNEAWVLRAFLETTSQWADYIIIADQMSTDGSRKIMDEYPKVIRIDNTNPNFNEAERQAMLVAKAREVAAGRDTILWGLDADEVLAANTFQTKDWEMICNSKPGDVFWFKWAEIGPNQIGFRESEYYPWCFHDDGIEPHGNYVRNMHSMRIPYPIEEKQMYYIQDFYVLHLAHLNQSRTRAKQRFYQFVDYELNHRHCIKLARTYHATSGRGFDRYALQASMVQYPTFNVLDKVDTVSQLFWFDDYVVERIKNYPASTVAWLDIWWGNFAALTQIPDPRKWYHKLLHSYLHTTARWAKALPIRAIDKVLRKFI